MFIINTMYLKIARVLMFIINTMYLKIARVLMFFFIINTMYPTQLEHFANFSLVGSITDSVKISCKLTHVPVPCLLF